MSDLKYNATEFHALMAQVGHTLHSWAGVETGLALLFSEASQIQPYDKCLALFDAIVAFDSRLAVVEAAILHESTKLGEVERAMWGILAARLRKFYKKRHEVAHFYVSPQDMEASQRISPYFTWRKHNAKTLKHLSKTQMQERATKFVELDKAIMWFAQKLHTERTGQPITNISSEETTLISRLRALALLPSEERGRLPQSGG